jgi:hypothetical protein
MNNDDWLWYLACNAARRDRFLKKMYWSSGGYFTLILFFAVMWRIIGFWSVLNSLTYIGINFLFFAMFVHLSDRLFLGREQVNILNRTDEGKNLDSSLHIVRRKKLGIISLVFLFLGFLSEAGTAIIAALNH